MDWSENNKTWDRIFYSYFILDGIFSCAYVGPELSEHFEYGKVLPYIVVFLAPLCVVGAETIVTLISKRSLEMKTSVLLLIVLIPYFLFQTSFLYEVTKSDSWSVSLSKYRMNPSRLYSLNGYTDVYNASGAQWLSNTAVFGHSQIYADYYSRIVELEMYSTVYLRYVQLVSNTTEVEHGGLVYFGALSTIYGTVTSANYIWNLTESHFLDDLSKICSNGRSEVYANEQ